MLVEYVRQEPPGIPVGFWRGVGPTHNVFVVESFIDELAAAAKKDPVEYRRALLGTSPRAKGVLELAAMKASWGEPLPEGHGRGVSVQFVFGSYVAQVVEVEVASDLPPPVRPPVQFAHADKPIGVTMRVSGAGGRYPSALCGRRVLY
jgi:isoquinoline 1-oxidoreductase subunit beta